MKRLLYPAVAAVMLSLAASTGVRAQEDAQLRYVRESVYKLNYGDMLEWNENFIHARVGGPQFMRIAVL